VTYNAIIDVPNPQLKLKPGMTTNVKIVIDKAEDTLKIPNSALRFTPNIPEEEMEAAFKAAGEDRFWSFYRKTLANSGQPAPGQQVAARSSSSGAAGASGVNANRSGTAGTARPARSARGRRVPVWVANADGTLRPVVVQLGLTDGVHTQVLQGKLQEGQRIVTGLEMDRNNQLTSGPSSRPPGFGGVRRIR
jgi:HlyD family secretion protein